MPQFSTRHPNRTKDFFMKTFSDGLNQEISPNFLPITALTRCKNIRYFAAKAVDGSPLVQLQMRQGTEAISTVALGSAVTSCTYYINDAHYIVATNAKAYELDDSFEPAEIGTVEGRCTYTEFHDKLIIHDGAVTKAWNGTAFETLNCLYEDEVLGTGNNSTTQFTGTLAHIPVKAASLTITYTDAGLTKTITSTAGGALEGDVDAGGANTINFTTGEYDFTCSGAPDNTTSIYATYELVGGAPKSKAGFVRASRLYMWGDPDNPSRLWYSGPNDEDGWDTSSSGGYLDVDKDDGYSIIGAISFFDIIIVIKGNTLYQIPDFPGDSTFRVRPLMQNTGAIAYQTINTDGKMVTFLSKQGWMAVSASDLYGNIAKAADLSASFRANAVQYADPDCFSEFNQNDNQLWMTLYNGDVQGDVIYVINLETGGQLSLYEFEFAHSCYKFVNGEMLIGGTDGHLYRLMPKGTNYTDNGTSYSANTYFRGVMTDWGIALNRKHNKKLYLHCYGPTRMTATFNIYTDGDYATPIYTAAISTVGGAILIWAMQSTDIYDMTTQIGAESVSDSSVAIHKKFNYRQVMVEVTDIAGNSGAEFFGVDFSGAILGE